MGVDYSQADIRHFIIHTHGLPDHENEMVLSKNTIPVNDESLKNLLLHFFIHPFKNQAFFYYSETSRIAGNTVYPIVTEIFGHDGSFAEESQNLASRLDEFTFGNLKNESRLYVIFFTGLVVGEELVDAIGIFKTERKEQFLKIIGINNADGIEVHDGIPLNKPDYGCLIFNTEADQGYKALVIDPLGKKPENLAWINDFLQLQPRPDDFYATRNVVEIITGFCSQLPEPESHVERTEQIVLAQKAADYFKTHEDFDFAEFEHSVIEKPEIKKAFNDYRNMYQEANEIEIDETFKISPGAIKDAKKYFRSVIKLDKNFHVYVHAKPEYIEKGFDQKRKLNFYKLFYDNES